jgi:ribosomal protein L7/L12
MKITVQVSQSEALEFAKQGIAKSHSLPSEYLQVEMIGEFNQRPQAFSLKLPAPITVLEKIMSGDWIAGIKEIREITGWGLKESKDYVENLRYNVLKKV